jgi:hypothetical protein
VPTSLSMALDARFYVEAGTLKADDTLVHMSLAGIGELWFPGTGSALAKDQRLCRRPGSRRMRRANPAHRGPADTRDPWAAGPGRVRAGSHLVGGALPSALVIGDAG